MRCKRARLENDRLRTKMPHQTLDPAQLQSWRDLLTDAEQTPFIRDLIDDFLVESGTQLAAIQSALLAGDTVTCRAHAHRLLGICGVIGARQMMGLCTAMETQTDMDVLARQVDLFSDLQQEYVRVLQALEQQRP